MKFYLLVVLSLLSCYSSEAQKSEPIVRVLKSAEFESPSGHDLNTPISYGEKGLLLVSNKRTKSFNFKMFSNDLTLIKENTSEPDSKLSEHSNAPLFLKVLNKSYLFTHDIYRDKHTEGVSALEFYIDKLDFKPTNKKLFESSGKVRSFPNYFTMGQNTSNEELSYDYQNSTVSNYRIERSANGKFILFSYCLFPAERDDKINKDVIGMRVFDNEMNEIWGREVTMPYTERKIESMSFMVTNEGKVIQLLKVYDGGKPSKREIILNYHLDLLVYDKVNTNAVPKPVQLEGLFPATCYIQEMNTGRIILTGSYSKSFSGKAEGIYLLEFDRLKNETHLLNRGIFEFKNDNMSCFSSTGERESTESASKLNRNNYTGPDDLIVRCVKEDNHGNIQLILEKYHVDIVISYGKNTTVNVYTSAGEIYIMNLLKDLNYSILQLGKMQFTKEPIGLETSFNKVSSGSEDFFLFMDNTKNLNLKPGEHPYQFEPKRDHYLACLAVDEAGNVRKYDIKGVEDLESNFYIRKFGDGSEGHIVSFTGKKGKYKMISFNAL